MGHLLNIESDEAVALATELAELTGKPLDTAVTSALRSMVEQERRRHTRLLAIREAVEAFHAQLGPNPPSLDHDWLYDEATGLPK